MYFLRGMSALAHTSFRFHCSEFHYKTQSDFKPQVPSPLFNAQWCAVWKAVVPQSLQESGLGLTIEDNSNIICQCVGSIQALTVKYVGICPHSSSFLKGSLFICLFWDKVFLRSPVWLLTWVPLSQLLEYRGYRLVHSHLTLCTFLISIFKGHCC